MATIDLGFSGEMRVVDVETTGLYPYATKRDPSEHKIISVCVMPIHFNGEALTTFGKPKTWVVDPGMPIPPAASRVNGFRDKDMRGMPCFADVAQEIRDAIGQNSLVGHNVTFDKRFLRAEFERVGGLKSIARCKPVCTMGAIGTLMHGVGCQCHEFEWDWLSLDRAISLFSRGAISRKGNTHSAEEDVVITANLASMLNELAHLSIADAKQRIQDAIEVWPEKSKPKRTEPTGRNQRAKSGEASEEAGAWIVPAAKLLAVILKRLARAMK